MGKSLSLDVQERVNALVEEGLSRHEVARCLRISTASAMRVVQRKKPTGGLKAAPQGHSRCSKQDVVSDWLKANV